MASLSNDQTFQVVAVVFLSGLLGLLDLDLDLLLSTHRDAVTYTLTPLVHHRVEGAGSS